jgi:hypothetical protein
VRSVPICYKQGSGSNELVVRQSPAGKNVSTEAEDIVEIRHQATAGEDKTLCVLSLTLICEVSRPMRAYSLFVVTFCKCSIQPTANSNPVYSHTQTRGSIKIPLSHILDLIKRSSLSESLEQWA